VPDDHDHDDGRGDHDEYGHDRDHGDDREHADDHAHEHGSGPLGRVVHAATEVFGGHSHDPADQVDGSLEASDQGRRAVLISLGVLAGTAALQAVVVVLSGSVALLGDTLHNLADALTAVPLLVAFRLARRIPTRQYTYGYGRAEDLAGVFVIAMIALSSVVAGWVAISRLIHPHGVTHLWVVAGAALIGFLGNEVVARYRITVGRRIGSAALVADGLHARTDGFTSLAVLVGAAAVAIGWTWGDPVIGLVITVAIVGVLRSAARQVFARLMDAVDPVLVDQIEHVLSHTDGVRRVGAVRVRWIGHSLHGEAEVLVDPGSTLAQAHTIAHEAEHDLLHSVHRLTSAIVHAGPDEPAPAAHRLAAHHRGS
jgi:cation diffusion facilitator family transporter